MRQVKAMIGDDRVHLEIRMSNTAEAAITYCRKDESCIRNDDGTPLMRREYGSVSKGSGYSTDLEVMVLPVLDDIRQGTAISVLRNKYPTEFLLHNNYFKEVAAQLKRDNAPKWRKTVCVILWGATGTNKTRWAIKESERIDNGRYPYIVQAPQKGRPLYWDDYDGHKCIVIDEFMSPPYVDFATFLRWLDGHRVAIDCRNVGKYGEWTHVFITSNIDPDSWYPDLNGEHIKALNRRLTLIHHLPISSEPMDLNKTLDYYVDKNIELAQTRKREREDDDDT
jgi:hypothetical protein